MSLKFLIVVIFCCGLALGSSNSSCHSSCASCFGPTQYDCVTCRNGLLFTERNSTQGPYCGSISRDQCLKGYSSSECINYSRSFLKDYLVIGHETSTGGSASDVRISVQSWNHSICDTCTSRKLAIVNRHGNRSLLAHEESLENDGKKLIVKMTFNHLSKFFTNCHRNTDPDPYHAINITCHMEMNVSSPDGTIAVYRFIYYTDMNSTFDQYAGIYVQGGQKNESVIYFDDNCLQSNSCRVNMNYKKDFTICEDFACTKERSSTVFNSNERLYLKVYIDTFPEWAEMILSKDLVLAYSYHGATNQIIDLTNVTDSRTHLELIHYTIYYSVPLNDLDGNISMMVRTKISNITHHSWSDYAERSPLLQDRLLRLDISVQQASPSFLSQNVLYAIIGIMVIVTSIGIGYIMGRRSDKYSRASGSAGIYQNMITLPGIQMHQLPNSGTPMVV